jgi:hypothetical protein
MQGSISHRRRLALFKKQAESVILCTNSTNNKSKKQRSSRLPPHSPSPNQIVADAGRAAREGGCQLVRGGQIVTVHSKKVGIFGCKAGYDGEDGAGAG